MPNFARILLERCRTCRVEGDAKFFWGGGSIQPRIDSGIPIFYWHADTVHRRSFVRGTRHFASRCISCLCVVWPICAPPGKPKTHCWRIFRSRIVINIIVPRLNECEIELRTPRVPCSFSSVVPGTSMNPSPTTPTSLSLNGSRFLQVGKLVANFGQRVNTDFDRACRTVNWLRQEVR